MSLEDFGDIFGNIFEIQSLEKRYGANYGGEYYEIRAYGLNLELVYNAGEMEYSEITAKNHKIYAFVSPVPNILERDQFNRLIDDFCGTLSEHKIETLIVNP